MATFYDKLGDLLNETLRAGEVQFVRVEKPEEDKEMPKRSPLGKVSIHEGEEGSAEAAAQKTAEDIIGRIKKERAERLRAQEEEYRTSQTATGRIYHTQEGYTAERYAPRNFAYKKRTPQIEQAYRLLGLAPTATAEDVKRAYKEKLMYYHPDHYADNPVLQKVAGTKTQQVVEAYRLLSEFLANV